VQVPSATETAISYITDPAAADFIERRGGKLYVWPLHHRCCGGLLTLLASSVTTPPTGKKFHRLPADGFDVYLDISFRDMPSELHVKLKGLRRKRIDVYWNGCAFLV
jgi:hypothetical protein